MLKTKNSRRHTIQQMRSNMNKIRPSQSPKCVHLTLLSMSSICTSWHSLPGIVYSLHLLFSKQANTKRSSLAPSYFIFLEHYNFQGHMGCGNAKRNQRPSCVQLWWAVQAQFSKVCRFGQFRVCYT
jgi:hypothetical protein